MHAHTRQRAIFNTIRIVRITMVAIFTSFFHVGVSGVEPYQYYLKIKNQKIQLYKHGTGLIYLFYDQRTTPFYRLVLTDLPAFKKCFYEKEVCHYNVFTNLYHKKR